MAEVIVLPKMGLTAEDGQILQWLVKLGEPVVQGQDVVEIETYKATLTVESPAAGVLRAAVDAGTTVPAGAVIGIVAAPEEPLDGMTLWTAGASEVEKDSDTDPSRPSRPTAGAAPSAAASGGGGSDGLRASPIARRLARELNVELSSVEGSGPRGRITEKDVRARAARAGASSADGAAAGSATGSATGSEGRRVPLTSMRRAIAALMTASAQVPQFTLEATVSVDRRRRSLEVSYSTVVLAACARTLRQFPIVNSSFDGDSLIEHADVNVGIAVALQRGLIVPVIHRADSLAIQDLDAERRRLVEAARNDSLGANDLTGGTFSVSNLGPLGIERFRALILPPQAAILAVGAVRQDRLALSLSCDHRVLDGEPAARFLSGIVDRLEHLDWVQDAQ
jgi:pyruvate dehydrogenase E2 component (dihydrolipoamide acetyltransferase)